MTLTLKVHEPLAAIVPLARVTLCEPAAAVIVPLPQVPVRPFGVATAKPAGSESVKATPFRANALGLLIVKLSDVEFASPIEAAPNVLAMVGGVATVNVAVAVLPVPPFVEVTEPVLFT